MKGAVDQMKSIIRGMTGVGIIGLALTSISCSSGGSQDGIPTNDNPTTAPYAPVPPEHPAAQRYPDWQNPPSDAQQPGGPTTPPQNQTIPPSVPVPSTTNPSPGQ